MEGRNVPGNAENPMSWDDVASKFRECASVAHSPPSEEDAAAAIVLARDLERLDDATHLIRCLGAPAG